MADWDRFKLWNECRPMPLAVEDLDEDAEAIGLRKEDIEIAVRSRLRAARLYVDRSWGKWLYVYVGVGKRSYSVDIEYKKWVDDPASGAGGTATTWDVGGFGSHGGTAHYILSYVTGYVDEFIDEYLRVNAEAYSGPGGD